MRKLYYAAFLLLLASCGDTTVKETLGLDRRAPDEFRVVSRPPLSVPPQFDLRPPGIDGENTYTSTRDKAQATILGSESTAGKEKRGTAAESGFLQKAGVAQADPNVRKELTEKKINEEIKQEENSWWDRITTLPGSKDPVVKADDEAERLKKNKEEGKLVTEGETPETGGGTISTLKHWIGD